jgi:APA family basic amino acid/polyamine antiporter
LDEMMTQTTTLKRELGVFGATMMGLGSILGTGVFVSIGIAAGVTGPSVVLAIALAAVVASFNALNSAQLAANHAVSGGTYEYGNKYLNSWFGFTAGWTFLLAKTASAATAALGFAGYLLNVLGVEGRTGLVPLALVAVVLLTLIVLTGVRRSNFTNILIVSVTILALALFVLTGLGPLVAAGGANFTPFFSTDGDPIANLLQATALMFVAYTGYGRIATMGEEVREPRRTIPRAIITAMLTTMVLYAGVAIVGVGTVGTAVLSDTTQSQAAPLEVAARIFASPTVATLVSIGAITAMLGVLLNLILGLSRVLLAMGRRGDMPAATARLDATGATPTVAVVVIGVAIAALVLVGNVKTTWSFSAFTVLVYYAITNLSALQLSASERLFPKWIGYAGLVACLFLAFWVEPSIWLVGLVLVGVGLVWHGVARWLKR